uniref:Phospholipid scramblase n=1 Tax=Alexandrium catenella TaxID=2925 RepID=A0A7S1RHR7_ALECA|mmetsp:Transcript_57278/g.153356  ORF Transcript_57278/g.153356 Transcript_57278/m.153356 type:complete len:357 (+) Transcript_57278:77-1147(+)
MASQFTVAIPAGIGPGQLLQATTPDGQLVQVQVPVGYGPGMTMPVAYTPLYGMQGAAVPLAMPVAAPGGMVMQPGGSMVAYSGYSDPWDLLKTLKGVKIKEKVQLAEVLIGFEMPNKYMLSDPSTGKDLFIAAEKSDDMMGMLGRQMFEGDQRPFNMEVALLSDKGQIPQPFLKMERPFKCTCCCFQRPEVFVTNAQSGEQIGSVVDPFACCMMTFDIKDSAGIPVMEINHNPCSCALCCWGCPCGCQEVDFEVKDKTGGHTVGHIKKQFRMEEAISMMTGVGCDADTYLVDFDQVEVPDWKAIILATALFLDYRFFNTGGQSTREQSALGRVAQQNGGMANMMGPMAGAWGAGGD